MKKIAIIGSGVAGLSSAALLAKKGYDVTLFEKNEQTGGRLRMFKEQGFSFDMGPSWYWMPEVFEDFFQEFNYSSKDFYQLHRLDPSYKVCYKNEDITIPAGKQEVLDLFEQLEPGSKTKIAAFLGKAGIKYQTAMAHYIKKPSHSIMEFMDWKILTSFLKLNLFSSIRSEISKVTKHPYIRQILEFPILFLGATPDATPALYSMMNHVDTALGTWYPDGGMVLIAHAMERIAKEQGVSIRLNESVLEVEMNNDRISGLMTDKNKYSFDLVVCAGDYHHFEQNILPKQYRQYSPKYWNNRTMSPSVLLFYIGIDRKLPNVAHHNLFFDADFEQHIHDIYVEPLWPKDPLFYLCCPSKTDASVAPDGMENLFALIPIANDLEQNESLIEEYFKKICERIQQKTGLDISEHLVYKRSFSVKEFKEDYFSFKGNAYGLANTLLQTAILKPKMRSKKVKNLYYAGQLTVPGPGLPPSIISGMIVANEIVKSGF